MRPGSLQSRLAVAMWVLTIISTLIATAISGSLLIRSHRESIRKQLQATGTSLLAMGISDFGELKDFGYLNGFIEDALQMEKVDKAVRIFDARQRLIFTSLGSAYDDLPEKLEGKIARPFFATVEGRTRDYESLIIPYEGTGRQKKFYLQVAIPLPKYSEMLSDLWWQVLLLLGALIGISMIASRFLAHLLLTPVRQIAGHLGRLDPQRIEEWEPVKLGQSGQYLQSIAEGINLLGGRTKEAIGQLTKMSRYVAHELRTPLTILQGEAETALGNERATREEYRQVLLSSLEEIRRMSEIVSTVLRVGERARSIAMFNPRPFDLAKWNQKNLKRWGRTLKRPIAYDSGGVATAMVYADPELLFRLMDNLVRNVREHAPHGAACTIRLRQGPAGTALVVADDGPGLPPATIESLNAEGSRSRAAGVGMNLCLKIAEICSLSLIFSSAAAGGLQVEIGFPGPRDRGIIRG